MKIINITILILIILFSCKNKETDVIEKEKIVDIFTDLYILNSNYRSFSQGDSSLNKAYYFDIMKKHNTTPKQLKLSIEFYISQKPNELKEILLEVEKKLITN